MTEAQLASRIPLEDYAGLLGAGEIEELRALAKPLRGRSIEMINSTAVGGGVAEILNRLVPLAEELELNMRWDVMTGGNDFFEVTKAFHNALHGGTYTLRPGDFEIFLECNEKNRASLPLDAEFMVIHDPQPAALIDGRSLIPAAKSGISLHRLSPGTTGQCFLRPSFPGSFQSLNIFSIRRSIRFPRRIASSILNSSRKF